LSGYAADDHLGIDGLLTFQARRLVCFAASGCSFTRAELTLHELCGWSLSDEAIRHACYKEAEKVCERLESDEGMYQPFQEAPGNIEFQFDAAKVNTIEGWRDMKIGIFAKREAGEPATAAEWHTRELPKPTARVAFTDIEKSSVFTTTVGEYVERLDIVDTTQVDVLADGAACNWTIAFEQLPGCRQTLDHWHGMEHVGKAARAVYGEGTVEALIFLESTRQALLADGWWGLCEKVGQVLSTPEGEKHRDALEDLLCYFSNQIQRLNYCRQLYQGRPIGSGMVEGACKNLIGKRLKQTKTPWREENVEKMAVLCCLAYSDGMWTHYWTAA
jgi:hypothetical protein